MSDHFQGQIEIFGFNFPPKYWAQCAGQILPIQQNHALLGTTYGGNGVTTFGLPDLRGRVPVGVGRDSGQVQWTMGQVGGTEKVPLTSLQIPAHIHTLRASSNAETKDNTALPSSTVGLGVTKGKDQKGVAMTVNLYVVDDKPALALHESAISSSEPAQPHENRMPLLALNFCIALSGIFPSRN
jgi:microcystin-dependent protein